MNTPKKEESLITLGGRVRCKRCQATAKRTQQQCRLPALVSKRVCRVHGGRSRGPVTPEGRKRSAATRTVHGLETLAIRAKRNQKLAELRALEQIAKTIGLIPKPGH